MKTSICCLAFATLLAAGAARADEASARAKLADEDVAFTPEAFLHEVGAGNVDRVALFLEAGIDPAVKNPAGADARKANDYEVPPLAEAARTGNLEMSQILLAAGADPNAAPAGFPLIYGPVNEDHPEVVKLLLESGAKLGEHKGALLEAAKTPEMRELLEKAE